MSDEKPHGPIKSMHIIAEHLNAANKETELKLVGKATEKVRLGLAVLASRLLHKIKGTSEPK